MGMKRSLAIQLVFLFLLIAFNIPAYADMTSSETCRGCPEGTSCKRQKAADNMWEYTCAPDEHEPENRCTGPCPNTGKPQVLINGRCECPASQPSNNHECLPQTPCGSNQTARLTGGRCQCVDNGSSGQGTNCQEQYRSLYQQCQSQIDDATYTCDEKNDSGLNNVSDTASQIALLMGQQTSGSIQAACSKMADFTQAANAAVAAYRLTCSNSIGSCKSACDQLVSYASANSACLAGTPAVFGDLPGISNAVSGGNHVSVAQSKRNRCNDFDAKISQANQAIQNYGATTANASQCAALTNGTGEPSPEFCKANPTNIACQQMQNADCSNPQVAATSKVCICMKTPNDPACISEQKVGGEVVQPSLIDSGSRLGAASGNGDDVGGDLFKVPNITPGQAGTQYGNPVEGSQGGGASLGGGSAPGGSGPGGGGGGKAADESSASVTAGFYGGGSGGGMMGYGGGYGSSNPGAAGAGAGVGANAKGAAGPDLRKFLPGGQFDPKRGLSGFGGADGITGPHTNIWEKIQNRYRVMQPSLLP